MMYRLLFAYPYDCTWSVYIRPNHSEYYKYLWAAKDAATALWLNQGAACYIEKLTDEGELIQKTQIYCWRT